MKDKFKIMVENYADAKGEFYWEVKKNKECIRNGTSRTPIIAFAMAMETCEDHRSYNGVK